MSEIITSVGSDIAHPKYDEVKPIGSPITVQITADEPPKMMLQKAPVAVARFQKSNPSIGKNIPAAPKV